MLYIWKEEHLSDTCLIIHGHLDSLYPTHIWQECSKMTPPTPMFLLTGVYGLMSLIQSHLKPVEIFPLIAKDFGLGLRGINCIR